MKIYTKSGDKGKTSLFSGEIVDKFHPSLRVYGSLDELNSYLGVIISLLSDKPDFQFEMEEIQKKIFSIGSWFATTHTSPHLAKLNSITEKDISIMEGKIDFYQSFLPDLHSFVLPGGHIAAAHVHVARTICRRTEREALACVETTGNDFYDENISRIMIYLNRLSDFLFVFARYINHSFHVPDTILDL
jgi:cob(I)alamin adenosyltransferase